MTATATPPGALLADPARRPVRRSVELFSGGGGLALGSALAGFEHQALVEWNKNACATLRLNRGALPETERWPVIEGDVRAVDFAPYGADLDLLAGGAPCQPFSLGGKHGGHGDERNMFPEVFRAARALRPKAILVENVKGLLRAGFRPYFDYILLQLEMPYIGARPGESWEDHKARLEGERGLHHAGELRYEVRHQLINCADFGVPQRRERVFIVAFRSDLGQAWRPLAPTHYKTALDFAKYVDGSYWEEHGLEPRSAPSELAGWAEGMRGLLRRGGSAGMVPRWRTVRDALRHPTPLPEPVDFREAPGFDHHFGNPGARSYPGHTGSPPDLPAKTLKAGDHGVPGGENTLALEGGGVRYFTVREAARLQTFPDEYRFFGAWVECFRQLGNAVPVEMARQIAAVVRAKLDAAEGVAAQPILAGA